MKLPRLGQFTVLVLRETPPSLDSFLADEPALVAKYWHEFIKLDPRHNPDVETFWILVLSCRRRVLGCHLVSTGTQDTILVHPREVFRAAIVAGASAIVLLHNHPSGEPSPSEADIRVTRELARAGELLKIPVLDHIIIGQPCTNNATGWVSLREYGVFTT